MRWARLGVDGLHDDVLYAGAGRRKQDDTVSQSAVMMYVSMYVW